MKALDILLGCEESQEGAKAWRALGHNAFSCDVLPCSGGHPEWHLQMDVFEAIKLKKWHCGIFFPDCTFLTNSAAWAYKDQPPLKSGKLVGAPRRRAREQAHKFVRAIYDCEIESVAIWLRELNASGYAGILSNGQLVDRREHPEAIPVQENVMFGVVKPKKLTP